MNAVDKIGPIDKYLTINDLIPDDLMEGYVHFGTGQMEEICQKALDKNSTIEFYYATDQDLLSDKLSYRFIDRENP